MTVWLSITAAIAGIVAFLAFIETTNKRRRAAHRAEFQSRPQPDLQTWFNNEFRAADAPEPSITPITPITPITLDHAVACHTPIAQTLGCEVTQLRASDSFNGTLRSRALTFLGVDDDNLWDEYVEHTLFESPDNQRGQLTGQPTDPTATPTERTNPRLQRFHENPTLRELVKATQPR